MTRALGLNHVSINVVDLEEATRFYVQFLGCRPVATPDFGYPVQWLELGELHLHLFVRGEVVPPSQHFAVDVEDIGAAHAEARALGIVDGGPRRFPDGTIQLYVRDPSGNRIEIDGRDDSITGLPQVPGPPEASVYSARSQRP